MAAVSPAPALAFPSGAPPHGATSISTTILYHPLARRPISSVTSPKFLLNPSADEETLLAHMNDFNRKRANKKISRSSRQHRQHQQRSGQDSCEDTALDSARDLAIRNRQRELTYPNEYVNILLEKTTNWSRSSVGESNEMALIELVLQPKTESKRASKFLSLAEVVTAVGDGTAPTSVISLPPRVPPKSRRRSSFPTTPQTDVVASNICQDELKNNMEEVKVMFAKKQFRKCASKCEQLLLAHSQQQPNSQPLYSLYINFYLALSTDQSARSLPRSSPTKRFLFNDSLTHLECAKTFIPAAALAQKPLPSLPQRRKTSSASTASARSSTDSLFSQYSNSTSSSTSSGRASPNISKRNNRQSSMSSGHKRNASSTSSAIMRPAPLRVQKKVAFAEPTLIGRRDSAVQQPGHGVLEEWGLIDCFPMPPSPSRCPSLTSSASSSSDFEDDHCSPASSPATPYTPTSPYSNHSVERFQSALRSFEEQVDWHITSIKTQLSLVPQSAILTGGLRDVDLKKEDYLNRVKKRRETGWGDRKKRFDPKRYQDLCEAALVEVTGSGIML